MAARRACSAYSVEVAKTEERKSDLGFQDHADHRGKSNETGIAGYAVRQITDSMTRALPDGRSRAFILAPL